MRVLAISNFKGGCAKTTTAVNLAACLAELGKKVLLIDLDPQMSATQWLALQQDSKALFEVFSGTAKLEDCVMPTTCEGLEAVPGSRWLIGLDKAMAGEIGAELALSKKLQELPKRWDVVILDCPPATGLISLSALSSSDGLIIPLEPSTLSTGGLVHMLQTVDQVKDRLNSKLEILGILACRVDRRTRLGKEVIEGLRKRFGNLIFKTEVRQYAKLRECPSFGVPITMYDSKGAGSMDYRQLAKETIKRIKKHEQVATKK